jgi:hypothetical protein
VQANRASGIANREIQIDALTFTHWVDAYTQGDKKLAEFYSRRFRPEFRLAVNAWADSNRRERDLVHRRPARRCFRPNCGSCSGVRSPRRSPAVHPDEPPVFARQDVARVE